MADEYIPMEFYTDDTIAVDLGEVIKGDTINANYNQTDPTKADYIIGREKIQGALHIGCAYIYHEYNHWGDTVDVTDTITYKPDFDEAWTSAFKPMAFTASMLGSGIGDGYIFYSHYCLWDWFSKSFDLYFRAYTESGEIKVVKLHYQYSEEDTSTPQSITAYLVEQEEQGNPILTLETTSLEADTVIEGPSREVLAEYAKNQMVRLNHRTDEAIRVYTLDSIIMDDEEQSLTLYFTYLETYNDEYYYVVLHVTDDGGIRVSESSGALGFALDSELEELRKRVETALGDIEATLDGIITIQEALMVGNTEEVLDDLHEYAQNIIDGGDTE